MVVLGLLAIRTLNKGVAMFQVGAWTGVDWGWWCDCWQFALRVRACRAEGIQGVFSLCLWLGYAVRITVTLLTFAPKSNP